MDPCGASEWAKGSEGRASPLLPPEQPPSIYFRLNSTMIKISLEERLLPLTFEETQNRWSPNSLPVSTLCSSFS